MENPYAQQIVDEANANRRGAVQKVRQLAGVKVAKPILLELLHHAKYSDLRIAAAEALGSFSDDKDASEALIRALEEDGVWHVRTAVLGALGRVASPKAIRAIRKALKDKAYGVRADAQGILDALGR